MNDYDVELHLLLAVGIVIIALGYIGAWVVSLALAV